MGVLVSSKVITTAATPIPCDGTATVTLNLTVGKSIAAKPLDIILILDESESMKGAKLEALKAAANKFIDIMDSATNNGTAAGTISGGSRIGIVKFHSTASFVKPPGLSNNVSALKAAINSLKAQERTCHGCAFKAARENFDTKSTNTKMMILFTDGMTTVMTYDPNTESSAAKAAGTEIYCIGLGNPTAGELDVDALKRWATNDSSVLIAPGPGDLVQVFDDLAKNITKPGATEIVIEDFIYDDFEIIGTPTLSFSGNPMPNPEATVVVAYDKKSIKCEIAALGVHGTESASLVFEIRHVSRVGGNKPVNKNTTYTDAEGNTANFPNQDNYIKVKCCETVSANCCNPPETIHFDPCEGYKEASLPSAGAYNLTCSGRLLNISVKLQNICPDRKIAIGVIIYEIINGQLQSRGFKAVTVTTPSTSSDPNGPCRAMEVGPFEFVLPEPPGMCGSREFRARVVAHYVDVLEGYKLICPI